MAQRTEKEEQPELIKSVPEALTFLCINNCGLVGNPATNNMCQKCFLTKTTSSSSRTSCSTSSSSIKSSCFDSSSDQDIDMADQTTAVDETKIYKLRNENVKNRCFGCRKKVGLTGFRCRCGELFCGQHRYSDRHNCSYDYKTVGREMIARENPVVKAAKIVRI